ncbi:MAG TPA: hypothetical protein VGU63_09515 [Candidatus Acidoferrales bacterium]|nr:hypothetical protein [Candidatus Acidoferrales bacterium]
MRMQKRLGIATLLAILAGLCAPALVGRETRQPRWSENLSSYGYSLQHPYSDVAVAASNDNVAVALNVSQDPNATASLPAGFLRSNWKLSLLMFNASSGKFRTACGPWFGSILFNLWSTSDGNFLLYQEPQQVTREKTSGRVLLLSPSCQVLKKIQLPALGKQGGIEFLISPTQRTFLIAEQSGRLTECQVQDANTLLERFKKSIDPDDPRVVAVSDEGLLGVKPMHSGSSTRAPVRFFYFTFQAQAWSEIPGPNLPDAPDSVTFASNGAFMETVATGSSGAWAKTGIRISIRGIDGTAAFSTAISRRNINIAPGSPFAVSPTGNYFGVVLSSYSVSSFWRFFDMSPRHDEVYIWSRHSEKPLVQIGVRSGSLHQQLAFAPDDSWFALRNGKMLVVRPLQRPPIPNR